MDLRPLERADHDDWLALWKGYQTFYKTSIAEAVSAETFERLLDPAEPVHGVLAIVDGKVVGLVQYLFHRSTWTTGDYCYLQDLFVDDSVRGQGVGRALIAHVRDAAISAGASRVYWLTHETNSGAIALYDKVADRSGFIQYRQIL